MTDEPSFPRGTGFPTQSPLFWVEEKDRYLRQLLISDIEKLTRRNLVVYYTDCNSTAQIDNSDDKYLLEMLSGCRDKQIDLLLETNGGYTDATEKVVSILRHATTDLRVIVPKRAKSNGTVLALAAREIVLGVASELGPIDPTLTLAPNNAVPAQFILQAAQQPGQNIDPIIRQAAQYVVMQTQKLATNLLTAGMLAGKTPTEIEQVVQQLSTRDVYHSHGSVIDHAEATRLGLKATLLPADDPLWKWLWLLRCMYERDARARSAVKIFEGPKYSSTIRQS
jgi:hypothetical protein